MSEHSRPLESTRHCVSDRKPKGTITYIAVAIIAVLTTSISARHEAPAPSQKPVANLLQDAN